MSAFQKNSGGSVVVVDSGGANLASVMHALRRAGVEAPVTADAAQIRDAEKVILPGVGAAGASMRRLREKNLVDVLRALTQPVLGLCLGMQLLFERSEENDAECLGVIPGKILLLPSLPDLPVPHMGWNSLQPLGAHPLLNGLEKKAHAYFVHSYYAPADPAYTIAATDYGVAIAAMVASGNWMGCQFHPERSAQVGAQILKNFVTTSAADLVAAPSSQPVAGART